MQLYRFSPIKSKDKLLEAIEFMHFEGHKLCKKILGKYLPNAGNFGIFCHYDEEFELLKKIRDELTEPSDNPKEKYFLLRNPIVIPSKGDVPETTYTYLYIRRPDPYRHHIGDVDYYLEPEEYEKLKQSLLDGTQMKGARTFQRPDLDMIELYDPDVDVLVYISDISWAERVRIK